MGVSENSEAKATNMMVVMERLFSIDHASDVSELFDVAGDGYGSLLVEPVFFLCLLEKLHEEWVVEVHNGHHEPLLLLCLSTHLYCQTPFGYASELLLLPMTMTIRTVQMKPLQALLPTPHLSLSPCEEKDNKRRSQLPKLVLCVCVFPEKLNSEENRGKQPRMGGCGCCFIEAGER